MAWSDPQPGPLVQLGTITIVDYGGLIGEQHVLDVNPYPGYDEINFVNQDFEMLHGRGWNFILNCVSEPCDCSIAVDTKTWSALKGLY